MREVIVINYNVLFYVAATIIIIMFFVLRSRNKEIESLNERYKKQKTELDNTKKKLAVSQKSLDDFKDSIQDRVNVQLFSAINNFASKSPFNRTAVFKAISSVNLINEPRFIKAYEDNTMCLVSVPSVSAKVRGQSGNVYDVSLDSCTCEDYRRRKQPCKHMYRLGMYIGALSVAYSRGIDYKIEEYIKLRDDTSEKIDLLRKETKRASRDAERNIAALKKEREKTLISLRKNNARFLSKLNKEGYNSAWIAKMYGDYYDMFIGDLIRTLENKVRPAHASASRIEKNCRAELRELAARAKHSESLVLLYESFYPNLPALCDMTADDIPPSLDEPLDIEPKTEYDSMKKWISRSEYDLLPRVEKYQLALDNYKHRNRSNWAAGIDFERYICYLYELKGYRVVCFGALNGLADLGRDLYAFKDNEVIIIQCKRWSSQKLIHEKHVYQLFGTVTDYCIDNPLFNTHGLLIATCNLSDKAREAAGRIGIEFEENVSFPEYPMVKCNINRTTGEKIYHLPFDQQYDKVQIEHDKGEFYAWTVSEAERRGFRRAFRHITNSTAEH